MVNVTLHEMGLWFGGSGKHRAGRPSASERFSADQWLGSTPLKPCPCVVTPERTALLLLTAVTSVLTSSGQQLGQQHNFLLSTSTPRMKVY